MAYKVAFETFGCRLNQAETAVFAHQFLAKGYRLAESPADADLCVINTCNLTSQATAKCRRLVRSIVRRNPDVCIATVGCYAQTSAEELQSIQGIDYIVGTADKMRLTEIIPSPTKLPDPVVVRPKATAQHFTIDGVGYYPARTRANIKVQEGCNFVCSFCIIPKSRGPARSRDFDDILREARVLAAEGHREVVITGVNVGTYEDRGRILHDVIDGLEAIDGLERIRLSSIEPTTIDTGIIDRMADGGKLCPYLHVPLQSGDDGILSRMRRRYTARDYIEFMHDAGRRVPGVGFGTDVIVGFPGENDDAFDSTIDVLKGVEFTNIHVFSFSARKGTGAFGMSGQVPGEKIAERSRMLHRLAEDKKRSFYTSHVGRRVRVLFEGSGSNGLMMGYSDNYVRVAVVSRDDLSNCLCWVEITHVTAPDERIPMLASGRIVGAKEAPARKSAEKPLVST